MIKWVLPRQAGYAILEQGSLGATTALERHCGWASLIGFHMAAIAPGGEDDKMSTDCDFLVIGAGIAGSSAGYELSGGTGGTPPTVIVVEREDVPGYHATGRSSAHFTENTLDSPIIHALCQASVPFLNNPPSGFSKTPLTSKRGALKIARSDQRQTIERFYGEIARLSPRIRFLDGMEALRLNPSLSSDYVDAAVYQPSKDIDVNALHQGFLRGMRQRGGRLVTDAEVQRIEHTEGRWSVETRAGTFNAAKIINAAGAWSDEIATMAGLKPLGLVPKRRTVVIFDPPAEFDIRDWPYTSDIDQQFYYRPDSGRIFATPSDSTPSPPCDARPEELDIAITVDRIERASTLKVERIRNKWAGLRSFFSDDAPVIGPDPGEEAFIWLAGQGGDGIKLSSSMARVAAAFATGRPLPRDIEELGLKPDDLLPTRLRGAS